MIPWLAPDDPFPPVERSLAHPNGLLAASRFIPSALAAGGPGLPASGRKRAKGPTTASGPITASSK